MFSSLRLALLLVFVAFPLVEIAVLIKVGQTIGFWPTIFALMAAAVLGILVVRQQGLSMVTRAFTAMSEGKPPIGPVLDGYALIVAGLLLIIPGLLSDAVGLILLIPPVRRLGIKWAISPFVVGGDAPDASGHGNAPRTVVIEGSFERVEDRPSKPRKDD